MSEPATRIDLTALIPARNEEKNIGTVVAGVRDICAELGLRYEVLVVDAGSSDDTQKVAREAGARVVVQEKPGYGGALLEGFSQAAGQWILTLDADISHPPQFIERLWHAREGHDLVVASRYVPGSYANMSFFRKSLSTILNRVFALVLALPVRDTSSGFRLYRRASLEAVEATGTDFNVLQHILVGMHNEGFRICEVPFYYRPRKAGSSNARIVAFGISYLRTLWSLWKTRNTITAADYDFRAFYSRHPFQRYWQRKRYRIVTDFIESPGRVLDVGAGSGVFAIQYPNVTALDLSPRKVRYLAQFNRNSLCAGAGELPFPNECFATVVCSEVIEHTTDDRILTECARVLQPGGVLIVGTPDYGSWQWPLIESIYRAVHPTGYADEHVNKYTEKRLVRELEQLDLAVLQARTILGGELIVKARKPS